MAQRTGLGEKKSSAVTADPERRRKGREEKNNMRGRKEKYSKDS